MSFIEIQELHKQYGERSGTVVAALNGIDLQVSEGEFIAISGPSGSGKTTLLNMLGTLDTPSSGGVVIEGVELSTLSESNKAQLRLHDIGFVFQAYNLIPVLSAMENMEYILMLQGVPKNDRVKRVTHIADALDITELLHKRPTEMSGGQQQRVAVARAVVSEPKLVLADEPTANLDSKTAERLMVLMQGLNRESNITFIFSTHDPQVMECSRRNIQLRDGSVCMDS